MARNYHQGMYTVKNPEKCINGSHQVRYLSSYEYTVYSWADNNPNVIRWGAETVIVPYYSSVKGRKARYIVDFYLEYRDKQGNIKKALCEIKPSSQCRAPSTSNRKKRSTLIEEQTTWITNNEKWKAAESYANERGWEFKILTEKEIYG